MRGTGGSGRDVEDAEQPGNTEAAAAREAGDFGDRMRQQMRERRAQLQRAAGGSSGAGELEGKGQPTGAEVTAERARDEYERLRRELGSDRAADKGNGQEAAGALKPAKKWRGKGASDSDDDDDSDSGGGGGSVAGMSELEKRRAKVRATPTEPPPSLSPAAPAKASDLPPHAPRTVSGEEARVDDAFQEAAAKRHAPQALRL
eukprot:scaffold9023_cov24-Tisochrysis_lutea.AAC.2